MIVIYLKLLVIYIENYWNYYLKLLVIYIANLYWRKISTFYSFKDEILVKNGPTSLHEKKIGWCQWALILIFCVDVHMELTPSPVHMRPPKASPAPPLCGRHKWMAPNVALW